MAQAFVLFSMKYDMLSMTHLHHLSEEQNLSTPFHQSPTHTSPHKILYSCLYGPGQISAAIMSIHVMHQFTGVDQMIYWSQAICCLPLQLTLVLGHSLNNGTITSTASQFTPAPCIVKSIGSAPGDHLNKTIAWQHQSCRLVDSLYTGT